MRDEIDARSQENSALISFSVKKKTNWLGILGFLFGLGTTAFNGVVYFARMPSGNDWEGFKKEVREDKAKAEGRLSTYQETVNTLRAELAAQSKATVDLTTKVDKLLNRRGH